MDRRLGLRQVMEVSKQWFEVINLKSKHCPLTAGLNNLYHACAFQQELLIPEQMGSGFWRRTRINPHMEIVQCDMTLYKDLAMGSREQDGSRKLIFGLGDSIQWNMEGKSAEFELESGGVSLFGRSQTICRCDYHAGRHFHGITVKLTAPSLSDLLQLPLREHSHFELLCNGKLFANSKTTPVMKRILHEIIHCPYREAIKRLYLEGKILELVAVYLNESLLEAGSLFTAANLSRTDIESLQQAKEILDRDLVSAPGLGMLSKLVCLNEFKLKKGFKLLFGMPVHAYVIDRRLELAHRLLETGKLNITNAAVLAGFNNVSHFAEKFRQKYGANPSQYFK